MAQISRQELLKLARMAQIAVADEEVDGFLSSLQNVVSYAERVKELSSLTLETDAYRQINVTRQDAICETDPETILALAPSVEEHYFVVPAILQHGNKE